MHTIKRHSCPSLNHVPREKAKRNRSYCQTKKKAMSLRKATGMIDQIHGRLKGTNADEVLKMQKQGANLDRTVLGVYESHGNSRKRDAEHNAVMKERDCARTKLRHEDNTTTLTSNEEAEIKKAVISIISNSSKPASIMAQSIFVWSTRPMRTRIYTHHLPDFCRARLIPLSLSEWLLSKTEEYIATTDAKVQASLSDEHARREAEQFLSWLDATSKAALTSALASAPASAHAAPASAGPPSNLAATAAQPETVDITTAADSTEEAGRVGAGVSFGVSSDDGKAVSRCCGDGYGGGGSGGAALATLGGSGASLDDQLRTSDTLHINANSLSPVPMAENSCSKWTLETGSANVAASINSSEQMQQQAQTCWKLLRLLNEKNLNQRLGKVTPEKPAAVGADSSAANDNALRSGPRVRPLSVCACACACGGRPQTATWQSTCSWGARSPSAAGNRSQILFSSSPYMLARMREIALRASNALALQCVSWWLGFGTMRGARSDSMVAAGFATCKQSGARLLHPSDRLPPRRPPPPPPSPPPCRPLNPRRRRTARRFSAGAPLAGDGRKGR